MDIKEFGIIGWLVAGMFAIVIGLTFYFKPAFFTKTEVITEQTIQQYALAIVRDDLKDYGYISSRLENIIVNTIDSASKKYRIPIELQHSVLQIESDYRLDAIHAPITVKGQTTRAKSLGGIVWEYWSDKLIEEGICETQMDLMLPDVNIMASAFILRWLIDDEYQNNKNLSYKNMLANVVKRYYGAHDQSYLSKLQRYTSDLWMKRLSMMLFADLQTVNTVDSSDTTAIQLSSLY